jgi:RNA polymerase sigma factor (TIGR02999 family)
MKPATITQLLERWSAGDQQAMDQLMPLVQDELRKVARGFLRHERPNHTLQPTALVNEAYIRIIGRQAVHWEGRAHFIAISANMMRRILVDHARKRRAAKRGSAATLVTFDEKVNSPLRDIDLIELDDTLSRLAEMDPRQARVVELRVFGGLSVEETAAALEVSTATVKRDWRTAKAWLFQQLRES